MLFSVIIPTYNRAHYVVDALNSVFNQTFEDYEIIVVDDGSSDGTQQYLQSLEGRVKVLTQFNRGPGAARNFGVQHARGDYLAFLDSDDMWFPWTLSCFAKLIRRHDRPAILGAKFVEFSRMQELAHVRQSGLVFDAYSDYFASHANRLHVGAGMSVIAKKQIVERGGFTDRRMNAEDHDLILRMGDARGFVQLASPVTLACRRHGTNATSNVRHTYDGVFYLLQQERNGTYPGGASRAKARRECIALHTRPVSISCIQQGLPAKGWDLYWATFWWHLMLGRIKYLLGFPVLACFARFGWFRAVAVLLTAARGRIRVSQILADS